MKKTVVVEEWLDPVMSGRLIWIVCVFGHDYWASSWEESFFLNQDLSLKQVWRPFNSDNHLQHQDD